MFGTIVMSEIKTLYYYEMYRIYTEEIIPCWACIPYVWNILQQQDSFNNFFFYSNDLINKVVMTDTVTKDWINRSQFNLVK